MAKKQDVNLSDFEANFVISSFKNKERRNNPSAVPKALVPDYNQGKEQEKEQEKPEKSETVQEENNVETKRIRSKTPDYESLFLTDVGIPTRSGKLVSIREKYHKRIAKIVQALDKKEVSIFSYIDNVLSQHFENYQNEISDIFSRHNDDDYFNTKK